MEVSNNSKVKELKTRIDEAGFLGVKDSQILRALRSTFADGDENKAFTYIEIMERSISGEVFPYQPGIKLLGAVNRNGTTCWMDSLLFAMFGRLDSFQAILYNAFPPEQAHKLRLAAALRLWVNLLRSGQLITVDIVSLNRYLENAMLTFVDGNRAEGTPRVWLDTFSKPAARRFGSVHVYHRLSESPAPHNEDGHLP